MVRKILLKNSICDSQDQKCVSDHPINNKPVLFKQIMGWFIDANMRHFASKN